MGRLEDLYHNRMMRFLKQKAQDIIEHAQSSKEPGDETGTQEDSYGALIFYNGGLVYTLIPTHKDLTRQHYGISAGQSKNAERHKGWGDIPDGTGIEWAQMLRNEIKSGAWGEIPKRGYCLVVFNAAFYSNAQEKGYGTHPGGWKIISQVVSDLKDIRSQFKGSTLVGHNIDINKYV